MGKKALLKVDANRSNNIQANINSLTPLFDRKSRDTINTSGPESILHQVGTHKGPS